MFDPQFQRFPDGARVQFYEEAKKHMLPASMGKHSLPSPMRTPVGGADTSYTIDNTPDGLHDVILRENGERWGVFWLVKEIPASFLNTEKSTS